jgi:hypothetical protein
MVSHMSLKIKIYKRMSNECVLDFFFSCNSSKWSDPVTPSVRPSMHPSETLFCFSQKRYYETGLCACIFNQLDPHLILPSHQVFASLALFVCVCHVPWSSIQKYLNNDISILKFNCSVLFQHLFKMILFEYIECWNVLCVHSLSSVTQKLL